MQGLRPVLVFLLSLAASLAQLPAALAAGPLFGFTPFPYDLSVEAIDKTHEVMNPYSSIYALHLDDGVPWKEVLSGEPLPPRIQRDWNDWKARIPKGKAVYLGLAPLDKDRKNIAPARGAKDREPMPDAIKGARLDDPEVKRAFLEYARRAIEQFRPQYVNLGIEAGEILSRDASRWPRFEALYAHVRDELKRQYPHIKFGISFSLQGLRKESHARKAKALVESSDYIGLSFYPHMSGFGEKFGDPPLGPGDQAWLEPLQWVRRYTDKPIAICETGFSTRDVKIDQYSLDLKGDPASQAAYTRDLVRIAQRDNYLFVVWFLPIDYDKLYEKLPRGSEYTLLWRNIGFLDANLRPKPAWEEWKKAFAPAGAAAPERRTATPPAPPAAAPARAAVPATPARRVGFSSDDELFSCAPGGAAKIVGEGPAGIASSMLWSYKYDGKDWQWCTRKLPAGRFAGAGKLRLWIRSDAAGPLFLQLEEASGEAYFLVLDVDTQWRQVSSELSRLNVDAAKRKNGKLEIGNLGSALFADAAGRDGKRGKRSVWIADFTFE